MIIGNRTVCMALLLFCSPISILFAQTSPTAVEGTPRLVWVDQLLADPNRDGIAGSACAVVRNDKILHLQGYGVQDRKTGVPIDPETTRFYLASVTKVFTATLVWRLIDQELLDPWEDISVYLDGQPEISLWPGSTPITLSHLLTHTAGFDDRNIGMAAESAEQVQSLDQYVTAALPPQVRPAGQITMYDNHGWALAGLICERVTGRSYPDLLQQEVFEPLNMSGSGVSNAIFQPDLPDFAQPYVTRYEEGQIAWKKISPAFRHTLPAGGICATTTDVAKFIQMHLNRGVTGDVRYLSESAVSRMQTQAWSSREGVEGLTPGFWETQILGHRLLLIVGSAPEGSSLIAIVPDGQLGIFLAASRRDARYLVEKLEQLLEGLVDKKLQDEKQAASSNAGWSERARKMAGEYYILRFSQDSMESLAKWQAWIRVEVLAPGKIRVVDSQDETRDYVEVSDYVFRNARHAGYITFKPSPDGATQWATTTDGLGFSRGLGFANSFQKARWYEQIGVKRPVLLAGLAVFLSCLVIWPSALLVKRVALSLRKRTGQKTDGPILLRLVVWCVAGCGLTGALGIAALLADTDQLLFGLPGWGKIPFALLWIFVVLTPVGIWLTVRAWVRKWWSRWERIFASIVVLTATTWIPFLWNWSLIGI